MVKIFTVHTMKPNRNSRGIAPLILNLYPLHRRLSGPQIRCEHCGVGKNHSPLSGFGPQTVRPVAQPLCRLSYPDFSYMYCTLTSPLFPGMSPYRSDWPAITFEACSFSFPAHIPFFSFPLPRQERSNEVPEVGGHHQCFMWERNYWLRYFVLVHVKTCL